MFNKQKFFEYVLREADKSRFLRPLYDEFKSQYTVPDYDSLLKFVNSDDPSLKDINWQKVVSKKTPAEEREYYFDTILHKFTARLEKQSIKQEKKVAHAQGSIVDMAKAEGLKVVEEGSDTSNASGFVHLASLDTDKFTFLAPMSWEACKFCDSVQAGGEGAKWCIGYEQNSDYWLDHLEDGDLFIFAFNKEAYKDKKRATDTLKYMIELSSDASLCQAWLQSDDPEDTIGITRFKKFFGRSAVEMVEAFAPAILIDDNAYNNNQSFIDLDTGEAQIPWEDDDLIDSTFYLTEFYNGDYDIEDKTPAGNGQTKGSWNKQAVFDKGYSCIVIECDERQVYPEKMHIGQNFGEALDLPTFFDWLEKCGVDNFSYVEFRNGTFTQVNWEPEASKVKGDVSFANCRIKRLNYTDFSEGEHSFELDENCIVDDLHWPVSQDDFYRCTADNLTIRSSSTIRDETYEDYFDDEELQESVKHKNILYESISEDDCELSPEDLATQKRYLKTLKDLIPPTEWDLDEFAGYYLVAKNLPFSVQYESIDGKHKHQFVVNKRIDKGDTWTWTSRFFSTAEDAVEYINKM